MSFFAPTAVAITTVSPQVAIIAPSACRATLPDSSVIFFPFILISSLFANTITDVGLGDKNYEEVQKIQSAITGGISSNFVLIPNKDGGDPKIGLKISSKSLEANSDSMFS